MTVSAAAFMCRTRFAMVGFEWTMQYGMGRMIEMEWNGMNEAEGKEENETGKLNEGRRTQWNELKRNPSSRFERIKFSFAHSNFLYLYLRPHFSGPFRDVYIYTNVYTQMNGRNTDCIALHSVQSTFTHNILNFMALFSVVSNNGIVLYRYGGCQFVNVNVNCECECECESIYLFRVHYKWTKQ